MQEPHSIKEKFKFVCLDIPTAGLVEKCENSEICKEIFDLCKNVMKQIREIDVPVICALQGIAAAAGCQLVAGCDIVLADRKSKFSVPGVNLGIYCHSPGVELGRAIPKKVAMHMLTTGKYLSAVDAFSLGLVSKLTTDDQNLDDLLDEAIPAVNATSRLT